MVVDEDEVKHKILDEELDPDPQGAPIKRVNQGVPRSIRRCASAGDRIFAEVTHVTTDWPLIDPSIVGASSSMTVGTACRHIYSMASWSPSQSDPLTVSYICHCQLSSPRLPRLAAMPPWAATV